jgi:16S rRNA (cytosine967-C5)-methyltransferase
VTAHDANPARMRDLAPRAARAGARIATAATGALEGLGPWPLVVVDAPCSGSGTWRRDPEAKWRLTPGRLAELTALQAGILAGAAALVAPGGRLAWITCSVLAAENADRIAAFRAAAPGWQPLLTRRWHPGPLGDGFSVALLTKQAQSPQG